MIDFIRDKTEFEQFKARLNELFPNYTSFENNAFNNNFKYFLGFEYSFVFHKSFFEKIKEYLIKIGNKNLIFYTIDPSPEKYFYKNFNAYSILNISVNNTDEELSKIMMDRSTEELAIVSDDIAWFSDSNDWAIIGSRDWEIAVVGFTSLETKEIFIKSFGESADMFTSVEKQVEILDEMLNFNNNEKNEYYKLAKNYIDKV
ncbi:hypothetical protein [Chryseobacterium sp. IT-36CA2]|uniref:hypothetical protein n=1 Tax=Chryseobacterium sp. IT-36CA2 TaxID=3026460 RepID=UPI0039E0379B